MNTHLCRFEWTAFRVYAALVCLVVVLVQGCSIVGSRATTELSMEETGKGTTLLLSVKNTFADGSVESYGTVEATPLTIEVKSKDSATVKAKLLVPRSAGQDSTIVLLVGGHRVEALSLMTIAWDLLRSGRTVLIPVQRGHYDNSSLEPTYGVMEIFDLQLAVYRYMLYAQLKTIEVDVVSFSTGGNIALTGLSGMLEGVSIRRLAMESPIDDVVGAMTAEGMPKEQQLRVSSLLSRFGLNAEDVSLGTLSEQVRPKSYYIVRGENDEIVLAASATKLTSQLRQNWGIGFAHTLPCGKHNLRMIVPCQVSDVRSSDSLIVRFINTGRPN